ncbi:MAG: hypothetical protein HY722_08165 [Planctomycetes bacterium]|nr:hypothetical protein [Planctomycetota bacterium]
MIRRLALALALLLVVSRPLAAQEGTTPPAPPPTPAPAVPAAPSTSPRVLARLVEGLVEVLPPGALAGPAMATWRPLKAGDEVLPGARLVSGLHARAVLQLGDDSVVRAGALTQFKLEGFHWEGEALVTRVDLAVGEVLVYQRYFPSDLSQRLGITMEGLADPGLPGRPGVGARTSDFRVHTRAATTHAHAGLWGVHLDDRGLGVASTVGEVRIVNSISRSLTIRAGQATSDRLLTPVEALKEGQTATYVPFGTTPAEVEALLRRLDTTDGARSPQDQRRNPAVEDRTAEKTGR